MIPPAFLHRRYRLLWIGMLISVAGSRMQTAAVLWHVHEISGQPIALGGVGMVRILPILALSLFAGVVADRMNRRRLLFLTQAGLVALAGLLAWMTTQGRDSLAVIYILIAASAAVASFDIPARQALIPNLVPADDLTNAFSLNSIAFQFGSIVGPAVGGIVIARLGIAYAYWINAATFLAVIMALILMGPVTQASLSPRADHSPMSSVLVDVKDGIRFVVGQPIIFSNMLLDFLATFFSSANALLPIFAKDILNVGAIGYGWLVSAASVGASIVAVTLSFVARIRRQGRVLIAAVVVFGLATVVFGFSRSYWLTFAALALIGASDSVSTIIRNTIRQLQTPDHLRGRMTSINQIFFLGGPELGELEAGMVAQVLGPVFAVVSGGMGCLLAVGWISKRFPQLPRYRGDEPVLAGDSARQPATQEA